MTQPIENKQSASFQIDTNFGILRPMALQLDATVPRSADHYAPTANRYIRPPCASIARGAKMESSGTRRKHRARHNQ
jgi:hypothetical protein